MEIDMHTAILAIATVIASAMIVALLTHSFSGEKWALRGIEDAADQTEYPSQKTTSRADRHR